MKTKIYFLIPITALTFSSCSNNQSGSAQDSSNTEVAKAENFSKASVENAAP